jgi:hypothetical protein
MIGLACACACLINIINGQLQLVERLSEPAGYIWHEPMEWRIYILSGIFG